MTQARPSQRVEWVPLDRITVVNPRTRNMKAFKEIVENIAQIGLKRPITVTRRIEADGPFYDLVCGQGRLEAYQALGQREVPALVVSADMEDCLIASLVENCARRQHNAHDLFQDVGGMRERGHSVAQIARKTGLSAEYVHGVARLLEKGEQRLLQSVVSRTIPISVAVEIADSDDHDVQRALRVAYERGLLKGRRLIAAQRLIEARRRRGKSVVTREARTPEKLSSSALVKAYQEDASRKREMIRRANASKDRLVLLVEAFRRLSEDQTLMEILAAENLDMMPETLGTRIAGVGRKP